MKNEMLLYFFIILVSAFVITVISAKVLIPKLKSIKVGQKILDIGPRWHKSKEGTPTMGGLTFMCATAITAVVALAVAYYRIGFETSAEIVIVLCFMFLNGIIGFADDYVKFIKKRNEGLSAVQKYFLQALAAIFFLFSMSHFGYINTELYIPYFGMRFEMGYAYYIIAFLLITGVVNSVNLTDGIDGLASSVTFIVSGFFAVVAFRTSNINASFVAALTIGSCLGFLIYNFHPARIFMGDTGSLFLGAAVISMAFLIDNPLIVVVAGIVYICESASDIIQVTVYKLTKDHKRVFKMAPIHHHFERCGWSELKIVGVFSAVTAVMCVVAYFGAVVWAS